MGSDDGRLWGLGVAAVVVAGAAVVAGVRSTRGSRSKPRTRDPRSVAIGETGRTFGTKMGVGGALATRFHGLVDRIDALELEVDAAYEQGDLARAQARDVDLALAEEQLWAMSAAVEEQSELLAHGPVDAEEGVDEILVHWYQHHLDQENGLYGGYLDDEDREQAKQNLARLLEDFGLSGLVPVEAFAMAGDAWRKRRDLRGRYGHQETLRRVSGRAGALEQARAFLAGLGEKKKASGGGGAGSPVRVGPRLRAAPQKAATKGKWREVEGRQPKWSWEVGDGTEYQVFFGRISDWSEEGWSIAYFDSPDAESGDRVGTGLFTTRDAAMQHAVDHHRALRSGSPDRNRRLVSPQGSLVRVGPRLKPAPQFQDGERLLRVQQALNRLFANLLPVENDEWHQLLLLVPPKWSGKTLFGSDLPPIEVAFQGVVVRILGHHEVVLYTPHTTNPRKGDHTWGPMHANLAAAHLADSLAMGWGFSPWAFGWGQRVKIAGGTWHGKYATVVGRSVQSGMGLSDRKGEDYSSLEGEPAYLVETRPGGGAIWYSGEALSPVRKTAKRGKS